MGIEIKGRSLSITAEQAISILERHTKSLGCFIDVDRAIDYQAHFLGLMRPLQETWELLLGKNKNIYYTQTEKVLELLTKYYGIEEAMLYKNQWEKKPSMDKTVVARLLESDFLSEDLRMLLQTYQKLSNYGRRVSYLEQFASLPLLTEKSYDGHRMGLARPEWKKLSTGRISASGPSLQNVYRDFADLVTHPKDWILLRADSGQIEPRITYSAYINDPVLKNLIIAYNDAYYGQLHFITMTQQERDAAYANPSAVKAKPVIKSGQLNIVIDPKEADAEDVKKVHEILAKDDDIRARLNNGDYMFNESWLKGKILIADDRQLLKKLGLAGNYGSSNLDAMSGTLATAYNHYIVNHPDRLRFAQEVEAAVDAGAETFYTYFGTAITPDDDGKKYRKGTQEWRNHLIRCGINNPIQGTASDLMNTSVFYADEIITNYAKGPTGISYYKHDEGAFTIAPQDKDLAKELAECTSYMVEGWIPIYSDAEYGRKHGMEDVPEIIL